MHNFELPENIAFEVGHSYKGHKGWFIVEENNGPKLTVLYEKNGNDFDDKRVGPDTVMYQRMVSRIMREEARVIPYAKDEDYNQKYFKSLGSLAKYATISAQVPPHSEKKFDSNYYDIKSKDPEKEKGSYYYFCSDKTWGPTIRIRFKAPKDLSLDNFVFWPFQIEIRLISDNEVEMNSINWGLDLLRMGFNLGKKHNIKMILSNIPDKYRNDFQNGLNII